MHARTNWLILAGIWLAAFLSGCAGTQPAGEARPPDFTLDALVSNPHADGMRTPRRLRPARYVVGADGELRVALGSGVNERTIPRRARTLNPGQLDDLWALVLDAGLADPGSPRAIAWRQTWRAPPGEPAGVISVTNAGRRVHSAAPLGASSGLGAPRVEALLDRLGELAWVPE